MTVRGVIKLSALVILCATHRLAAAGSVDIIGGQEANEADYKEVIRVDCGLGPATGVLVGTQALLISKHIKRTARARCQAALFDGTTAEFEAVDVALGERGSSEEVDLALGVLLGPPTKIPPAFIGRNASVADPIVVAGFGCTMPGGSGVQGILHHGSATIESVAQQPRPHEFVTRGSAACFGDSGAPAFSVMTNGESQVIGIAARSNIQDKTWYVNLTHPSVRSWLMRAAETQDVEICGVNSNCQSLWSDE